MNTSSAAALRQTLHEVIDDHTRSPYTSTATDTWDILEAADEDPGDPAFIITIYKNAKYAKVGGGTGPYNREHSWPKSYGFPNDNSSNYPYTDCHQLFLADAGYNSSRSNKPFRECSAGCLEKPTEYNDGRGGGTGTYPGNSSWTSGSGATGTWQTWNGRKGDVARAILYMDIRYEGGVHSVTGVSEPDLRLTDDEALIDDSNTGKNESIAYMGMLSKLIAWHKADPVDSREQHRNEVVYGSQGNRNPFIDHPEWVDCIYNHVCSGGDPPGEVHVGDLDGSRSMAGSRWRATVTITAHDADHNPVPSATVTGAWGTGGTGTCTTDSNGRCAVTSAKISGKQGSVSLTVTSLTHATLIYEATNNHDPDDDSTGTTITVLKEADAKPSVAITNPNGGSTVSGVVSVQIAALDGEDAAGTLAVEVSIDGGAFNAAPYNPTTGSYETSWDTVSVADGAHSIDARATDSSGNTTDATQVTVNVSNSPASGGVHVGDLDGSVKSTKSKWRATVTITVHDTNHNRVGGVTVSGQWISGGLASCTTDGAGQCAVGSGFVPAGQSANSFSVTSLSHPTLADDSAANHDPDGDSDGTTITVLKP